MVPYNIRVNKGTRMDRLSHVEEIELCKAAQSGCKVSKTKMITHNLGLVKKLANKMYFKHPQFAYEDLYQEGIFGLIRAIEKFNPKEGCRFSTYAYQWIRSFVGRYNENNRGKIRIPSHVIDKLRKCEEGSLEYSEIKKCIPVVVSLNNMIGDSSTLEDIVSDDTYQEEDLELSVILDQARKVLTEKEYDVLSHRYGLNGKTPKSFRECGKIYDVSYTAIYLIEKKSINKLSEYFATSEV